MPIPRSRTSSKELRNYLTAWIETGFRDGLVNRTERSEIQASFESHLREIVHDINETGEWNSATAGGILSVVLRECRDPDTGPFNHFEILSYPSHRTRPQLQCFVGHRFTNKLNDTIRSNLRYVLEPFNIKLIWSGMDLNATGFFDDILKKINMSDFCIFDTRDTDGRPNVFIEAGIAYALKRPFILASYKNNKFRVPSDLQHIKTIQYKNYRELTRTLYFELRVFLKEAGLHR
jgi:hypothetical protein